MKYAQPGWLGLVLIASVALTSLGCGSVEAPKSFTEFNAKDGTVKLQRPEGWEQKRGTAKDFRSVAFGSGPAKIRVLADVSGSLMAGPGAGMEDEDSDEPRSQGTRLVEERRFLDGGQEGCLQKILGQGSLAHQVPGDLEHAGRKAVEDPGQRIGVPLVTKSYVKLVQFLGIHSISNSIAGQKTHP